MSEDSNTEIVVDKGQDEAKEYALGVLKGAIGAIPFAGPMLNEVLFESRQRLTQQRLNEMFIEAAGDVAQLREDTIDKTFLASEEFSDLVENICVKAARTRIAQKRQVFRRVLVRALQGRVEVNFTDLFLDILDRITEPEMKVLTGFAGFIDAKRQDPNAEMGNIEYKDGLWGLSEAGARVVVQALVSKGLLMDNSFSKYDAKPLVYVLPTDLGAAFVSWLGAGEAP